MEEKRFNIGDVVRVIGNTPKEERGMHHHFDIGEVGTVIETGDAGFYLVQVPGGLEQVVDQQHLERVSGATETALQTKHTMHLILTDNETGETKFDGDITAIIGAVHTDKEDETCGLAITHCQIFDVANTLQAVDCAVEDITNANPLLLLAKSMLSKMATMEKKVSTHENTDNKGE